MRTLPFKIGRCGSRGKEITSNRLVIARTIRYAVNGLVRTARILDDRTRRNQRHPAIPRNRPAIFMRRTACTVAIRIADPVEGGASTVQLERQQRQHKDRQREGER